MTFRAAVIGCGKIGSTFADDPLLAGDVYSHAEAYARSNAMELIAVCDRDPSVAAACAERWNVAAGFTDIDRLLQEARPEIVSICTPDDTHFPVAMQVLEAPSVKGILCEKPLAMVPEQGEQLGRIAHDGGKTFAVAYSRRYAENMNAVADLLRQGVIGQIQAVSGWYGKGVLHNGSHWFDLLRLLAGEATWVEASDRLQEGSEDPSLDVTLGLRSGAVATLRALPASAFSTFEMDILLERGRVSIRNSGHSIDLFRAAPSERYSGYIELVSEAHVFGSMRDLTLRAVDDLADAVRSGRPPLCNVDDGLAALRIAAAARTSAQAGGRIEFDR